MLLILGVGEDVLIINVTLATYSAHEVACQTKR